MTGHDALRDEARGPRARRAAPCEPGSRAAQPASAASTPTGPPATGAAPGARPAPAPAPEPGPRPVGRIARRLALALCLAMGAVPTGAQEARAPEPVAAEARGPVTGLPLPRFVSLRASEARARRGPGLDHRVDWLYRRPGLPLRVTAEHGHWRRVEDIEGVGGWVHYSLISGTRTVIVTADLADLRRRADAASPLVAQLETGVLASLGECRDDWCQLRADGHRGWTQQDVLWGAN